MNEDLSREYQAVIAYVNYLQVLKGAAYMTIADELGVHAKEELDHALQIGSRVDYLDGMPSVTPKPVKASEKAEDMLEFDLENEKGTVRNYRRRVKQADELNEFAIAESLRGILVQEQDHLIALATALGIDRQMRGLPIRIPSPADGQPPVCLEPAGARCIGKAIGELYADSTLFEH